MPAITDITVTGNKLVGPLPAAWGNMSTVVTLSITTNPTLGGTLPAEWGSSMTKLKYLYLSSNNFSGSIPVAWRSMSSLTYLDVTNNQLSKASLPQSNGTPIWTDGRIWNALALLPQRDALTATETSTATVTSAAMGTPTASPSATATATPSSSTSVSAITTTVALTVSPAATATTTATPLLVASSTVSAMGPTTTRQPSMNFTDATPPDAPPPVVMSEAVRSGQSAVAGTAAIVSVLGSNPTAASLASRSTSLLGILQRCVESDTKNRTAANRSPDLPAFPIALVPWVMAASVLPSDNSSSSNTVVGVTAHRTAVVVNIAVAGVVAFAVLAVCAFVAAVSTLRGNSPTPLRDVLAKFRWPGVVLAPAFAGAEGIIVCSMTLCQVSSDGWDVAVASLGLGWTLAVELAMFVIPYRALHVYGLAEQQGIADDRSTPRSATLVSRIQYAVGWGRTWVAPDTTGTRFVNAFGMAFAKYHGPLLVDPQPAAVSDKTASWRHSLAPYTGAVDFVILCIVSVLQGLAQSAAVTPCSTLLWMSLAANATGFSFVLIVRPFMSPAKNVLVVASATLSLAGSAVALGAFLGPGGLSANSEAAVGLATASTVVAMLAGILSVAVALSHRCVGTADVVLAEERASTAGRRSTTVVQLSPAAAADLVADSHADHLAIHDREMDDDDREMDATLPPTTAKDPLLPLGGGSWDDDLPPPALSLGGVGRSSDDHPRSWDGPTRAPTNATTRALGGILLDVDDDDDDDLLCARTGRMQDSGDALSAMIHAPASRTVRRTAEGQARFDELVALLNGTAS